MPSVSLIIPCYNHAADLPRAVDSGLRQSCLAEVLIVDDHSTDDSLAVAQRLAAGDPRIKCLQTPANQGPGAARNLGAHHATGDFLSFLDADDELLGDFFADALAIFAAAPEMNVVKAELEFFDPVKGYVLPDFDPRHGSVVLSSACGLLIRRDVFTRIGGFSQNPAFRGPRGGEDVAFMTALIQFFQPIGRVERPCYRCWSRSGTHLDKFLANTRLAGNSFEFLNLHPDQRPGGVLSLALDAYLADVKRRLGRA